MKDIQDIPRKELDRRHEQARIAKEVALQYSNEEIYRNAEDMERKYRYEKIRRMKERQTPMLK